MSSFPYGRVLRINADESEECAVANAIRAQHDLTHRIRPVKIGPGEMFVSAEPDALVITVLGSCVSACIRDPVVRVGGMNHFMLPESKFGCWDKGAPSARFGNVAMERLIDAILAQGGMLQRLEVKLVGGAKMFETDFDIGERNSAFALDYLEARGLTPVLSNLRGSSAKRVHYLPADGRLWVKTLSHEALDTEGCDDAD